MLKTILAISGKPGLYKFVSRGKNMLIIESLDASKKRQPAYATDRVRVSDMRKVLCWYNILVGEGLTDFELKEEAESEEAAEE